MPRTPLRPSGPLRARAAAALAVVAAALLVAVAAVAVPTSGAGAATPPSERLAGSVVTVPADATVLGPADAAARLTVDVALRPRDPAALSAFVTAVSTPGDPRYHHYLAAGRFGAAFGPAPATIAAVRRWLASTGLVVGATSSDGLIVPVTGTTARIEAAFDDPLVQARLASGRRARLATRDPSVPTSLAADLTGVVGLGDQDVATPQLVREAPRAASAGTGHTATAATTGPQACAAISGYESAWTATELAETYGLSSLYGAGRTGAGQTVGIYELEPYTPSDIQSYQSCYGTDVPVTDVPVDGGATGGQQGEAALDIEVVAGLAPGASILVYSGPNGNGTGPLQTYQRMVWDDAAKVLTTSWGQCEAMMDVSERTTETDLFSEAAAQGQTVLAAAGDAGSSDCWTPTTQSATELAVDDPADQPDVVGVGGTSLTAAAPGAPTETTWNSLPGHTAAGGGGDSSVFAAPSWQQVPAAQSADTAYDCGTGGVQQCREVPDVAASADPAYGDIVFFGGTWWIFGGTSQAAPLWAALVADTDQGCASPAGDLGPALYATGSAADLNDVTTGSNALFGGTDYTARAGYDLATGWGSPRAAQLLGLFSGSAAGCPAVTRLSTTSGPASGGTTVTVTGSGFGTGTPVVDFGTVAAHLVSSSPTSVTVTTPKVTYGGTVGVTVTTTGAAAGTSAVVAASRFTFVSPQVTAVVPDRGPTAGGTRVTVMGSGFTGVTAVDFGTVAATSVHVVSSTSLTAVAPPGPSGGGSVAVHVTTGEGTSPATPAADYDYALPGYLMAASDGGVFTYGAAGFYGSGVGRSLAGPVVGTAMAPGDRGYWMATSGGQVLAFGSAPWLGSADGTGLTHPVVGMAATPDGRGYWLVASDGGIFAYGDAAFYGSTGNLVLNRPIVGMAATPDGRGYWLVASDGGIFAYGDAAFYGSTGNLRLNRPIVGMAATPDGRGYWLVASDGGIFAYGDAAFYGSTGNLVLNRPVVGMAVDLSGDGYWLVASDGGIFAYGSARFLGSAGALPLVEPVVGMAAT